MNKKGFTLIEIMAVVVVIGVICAIIFPKISNTISSSEINTSKLSAQELVDGLNNYVLDKKATLTPFDGCSYDFATSRNDCSDFEYSGKRPNEGILNVDGDGNVSGYVVFGEYRYDINNNKAVYSKVYVFDYTGGEQSLNIDKSGYYKLEVWGASGGNINSTYIGGYGGYSSGYVYLESGTTLYINVGGKGNTSNVVSALGGYNGGGDALARGSSYYMSSGGGATHIATVTGELSTLSNNIDDILIVAGGGGGSGFYQSGASGGSGGGITGVVPTACGSACGVWTAGSQNSGGSSRFGVATFGQGAGSTTSYTCGGGGGYYGGSGDTHEWGASGGSGYIGNDQLSDKYMYCYNCSESSDISTKTISTTNVSNSAVSKYAKSGDGYAIITYFDEYDTDKIDEKDDLEVGTQYVFDYIGNYQVFSVPTNGYYKIELWGSQGGDSGIYGGGYGAYTSGVISLSKNQNLYVYVGSKGTLTSGGYNGGGNPIDSYPGGGGATDIRYFSTSPSVDDLLWNSTIGLNSRIMVAGAGGGPYYYDSTYNSLAGQAGGLTGYPGEYYNTCQSTGGTQTSGGICTGYASVNGGFGYGGTGAGVQRAGGGGSGYYGGAARYDANGSSSAGGGGSSYISGHTGCVAVTSFYIPKPGCETGTTDNSCSIHFSGLKFSNTVMIDGYGYNWTNVIGSSVGMPSHDGNATMVGNTGDGFAKITYLGKNY